MSYKCPSCGHKDAWEGVAHIHCPNFKCQHFDEKLLDQLLEEHTEEREQSRDDATQLYGVWADGKWECLNEPTTITSTEALAEPAPQKWIHARYGFSDCLASVPEWEEAYNRLYRELAEEAKRAGKKCGASYHDHIEVKKRSPIAFFDSLCLSFGFDQSCDAAVEMSKVIAEYFSLGDDFEIYLRVDSRDVHTVTYNIIPDGRLADDYETAEMQYA